MLKAFFKETGIVRKDFFIVFILLVNAFTWLYMAPMMISSVLDAISVTNAESFTIWSAYYIAIIVSSIVGSTLSNKIGRLKFLYLWTILGVGTSLLPAVLNNSTVMPILVISIFLGASFGLGIPSCLAYFADHTLVENRGRIAGITLLTANMSAPLFAVAFSMFDLAASSIVFAGWRAFGLIIFFLKPEENVVLKMRKTVSFSEILHNKPFVFYFIAWLMFCCVDRFEGPIMSTLLGDFFDFVRTMSPIIGSLSAFIAGLLSDWFGRKRMILYGFITLGIAYAIIGIIPKAFASWYLLLFINGITAGILFVTFILILWGDLSQYGTREKYYALGATPLFLTSIIELSSAQYVLLIPETAFSVAAFFLFLAVLPLLYAPETLPERKIKHRQLMSYVEAARKVKERREEKSVKV